MTHDLYADCIGYTRGELGLEDVDRTHKYYRRDVELWHRKELEEYLGIKYFDYGFYANVINATKTGQLADNTYEYEVGQAGKNLPSGRRLCPLSSTSLP